MWPESFEDRLAQWADLKSQCRTLPLASALILINDWWFRVPIVNHYLHRQDLPNWPDPWQLLNDNIYCDLARALGIVYTLMDLDHKEISSFSIGYTKNDNLVLINQGIYILNWSPGEMLNISSQQIEIERIIGSEQLLNKYN